MSFLNSNSHNVTKHYEEVMSLGESLARDRDRVLYKGPNSNDVIRMGDMVEDIQDHQMQCLCALIMENTRREFAALDESTKLVHVGSFEKYAYPMVKVILPNLIAHNLVSVQPMKGPVSLVFYMKFLYNMTKGTAVAGTDMIENPNQYYTSEQIDAENSFPGDGTTTAVSFSLSYYPVRPATVSIRAIVSGSEVEVVDNGNGSLIGVGLSANGTINYSKGTCSMNFSTAPDDDTWVISSYSYDMEGNSLIPEIDMSIVSAPVQAVSRKIKSKWSLEAAADFQNLYGLDAEVELLSAISNELKFELDRTIITDLRNLAALSLSAPFSLTPSGSISFQEHKLDFVDELVKCNNKIYKATQRAIGNWIVGGLNVLNVIETLPRFESAATNVAGTRGAYYAGRLNGKWDVYKDANYPDNEYIVGYKGMNMWETGYIYAPYTPVFPLPTIVLDDFMGRKGVSSRAGKKLVDGRFYCKGSIST